MTYRNLFVIIKAQRADNLKKAYEALENEEHQNTIVGTRDRMSLSNNNWGNCDDC